MLWALIQQGALLDFFGTGYVVIAPTHHTNHRLTLDLIRHKIKCSNTQSSGGLHYNSLFIIQLQNGGTHLSFGHQQQTIEHLPGNFKIKFAHSCNSRAVNKLFKTLEHNSTSGIKRIFHSGSPLGLHAYDSGSRTLNPQPRTQATHQASTANRRHHIIYRKISLIQQLQSDGPLSLHHQLIVKGMNKYGRMRITIGHRSLISLVISIANQNYIHPLSPKHADLSNLLLGRSRRHKNTPLYTQVTTR